MFKAVPSYPINTVTVPVMHKYKIYFQVSSDDTRIFFLNMKNNRAVLEAAVRITIQNLHNTEAVIDGELH